MGIETGPRQVGRQGLCRPRHSDGPYAEIKGIMSHKNLPRASNRLYENERSALTLAFHVAKLRKQQEEFSLLPDIFMGFCPLLNIAFIDLIISKEV